MPAGQPKNAAPSGARSAGQSASLENPAHFSGPSGPPLRHAIVTEGRDAARGSVEQAAQAGLRNRARCGHARRRQLCLSIPSYRQRQASSRGMVHIICV